MISFRCIGLRVPRAAKALDCSPAKVWGMLNDGVLAYFRDGGITEVVYDWPGEPPPREGRAPSIKEYVEERVAATAATPKKRVPEGVLVGDRASIPSQSRSWKGKTHTAANIRSTL
jgi:hypothetical protein